MVSLSILPPHLFWLALILLHSLEGALSESISYLNPGFEFNYNTTGQPLPLPITNQCDAIHVTWSRTSNETGPQPVGPYTMQVYNSKSSLPLIVDAGSGPSFDWTVPFSPGTQYQTCMFDANGVSGGCQQLYSVLPSTSNATCQFPSSPAAASVTAIVPSGPMSQFSQINQCETLFVTPNSGSAPFTLTVAPESHPPYNITVNKMGTLSWQVPLPIGSKFFLSLSSSDGQLWSNGPMSVGGLGSDICVVSSGDVRKSVLEKIVVGSAVGGLVVGFALGALSFLIFFKVKAKRRAPSSFFDSGRYRYPDNAARDSPTRPLKNAPSTIGRANSVSAFSSAHSEATPSLNSIPLTPTTVLAPVRHADAPPLPPVPPITPPPRRPPRPRPTTPRVPYSPVPNNDASPSLPEFPLDVKQPIPPSNVSVVSRDDTASMASSSTNTHARSTTRPLSVHSRAPTYVPRSSNLRGVVQRIEETENSELPPEYGRHTADPHLKYAPSVLSSGNRF